MNTMTTISTEAGLVFFLLAFMVHCLVLGLAITRQARLWDDVVFFDLTLGLCANAVSNVI